MNKLKELLNIIDWRWIEQNPGRTYELLSSIIDIHMHDKDYIRSLEEKLDFERKKSLMREVLLIDEEQLEIIE